MDRNSINKPIQAHATGVPVDFLDKNHPQFPHDPEAQLPERPSQQIPFMKRKSTWIGLGVILVLLSYIAAALIGGKVGMGMAKQPVVYTTTTVIATTIVPKPTPSIPAGGCAWAGEKTYIANFGQCHNDCNQGLGPNQKGTCKLDHSLKLRCEVCDIGAKPTTTTVTPSAVVVTTTVQAAKPTLVCLAVEGDKTFDTESVCNDVCKKYTKGSKVGLCNMHVGGRFGCEECDALNARSEQATKTAEAPTAEPTCRLVDDTTFETKDACDNVCNKPTADGVEGVCKMNASGRFGCEKCGDKGKVMEARASLTTPPPSPSSEPTPPPPSPVTSSPPPPPASAPKKGISECFWTGQFSTEEECDQKCAKMDDKSTDEKPICNVVRGFYQCRTCKAIYELVSV